MKKLSLVVIVLILAGVYFGFIKKDAPKEEINTFGNEATVDANTNAENEAENVTDNFEAEDGEIFENGEKWHINEYAVEIDEPSQQGSEPEPTLPTEILYKETDAQTLSQELKTGVAVVDIRTLEEWVETGTIETSFLINALEGFEVRPTFKSEIEAAIAKNEKVVLVCNTNVKSKLVADYMTKELGYENVYILKGGIQEWIKQSLPLFKSQ